MEQAPASGRGRDRKQRLFACACCRHVWEHLDTRSRRTVEASERFADGSIGRIELEAARREVPTEFRGLPEEYAANAAAYAAFPTGEAAAYAVREATFALVEHQGRDWQDELWRDIFPGRETAADPAWLGWNDGLVPKLAQGIYDDRRFGDLPILGDALEDAGCDDAILLGHCRGGGLHARGCWVVDLLLDKERSQ